MTKPKPLDASGAAIDAILDLAGAPKKSSPKIAADLEAALGKPLAAETKKFLERPVKLEHPDADIGLVDFYGGLPDASAFIEKLGSGRGGFLLSAYHFLGLYPIGEQLQYGDNMVALCVLEPYAKGLAGVMYYDEREVGTWGASISAFLLQSLAKYCEEAGDDDDSPRDCFVFENVDASKPPPPAAKIPAPIAKAWNAHWRWRLERCSRWWVAQFLRGDDPRRFLSALPNEKIWNAEKSGVAKTHHEAMYWLLAHWLLGNEAELAEAVALAKKNPSKLAAALAAHVTKTTPNAKQKKQLDTLLEAVRLAAR